MKRFVVWLVLVSASMVPASALADPIARLTLVSQMGDFIGQGQSIDFRYVDPPDSISAQIRRRLSDGSPAELLFVLNSPPTQAENRFALLFFGTDQLGIPIRQGTYVDAERADFANPGHPGLDVAFQNRGSNQLTGSFTISDVRFRRDAFGALELTNFAAQFEQHSEGATAALFGRFLFTASPSAVPEPGSLVLCMTGAVALQRRIVRRRKSAAVRW